MPSDKILKRKQETVKELSDFLKENASGVLVSYKGITVSNDTKLRASLRNAGVSYKVIKNSILEFAFNQTEMEGLTDALKGTTALAVNTTDPLAAAKILCEYSSKNESFKIKGGFIDGNVINADEVTALSKLPPREVLVAQVLSGFNAPITGLVNVLNGNIRGLAVALKAIAEKKAS